MQSDRALSGYTASGVKDITLSNRQYYTGSPVDFAVKLYIARDKIFILCFVYINKLLRVAVHQRKPAALHLYHNFVAGQESM